MIYKEVKINLPDDVKNIIKTLNDSGFEGYAVGGCVRDTLLGLTPKDYDICTNALPEQMMEVFKEYRTIPTGIKHGTITVMINEVGYEVTTYRVDGGYSDNRHPDSVSFTTNLEEDLARRDFTINAMAYNDEVGLVDPYGGKVDLAFCLIKCVGNPNDRFNEDALRIMRALRFSSSLNFQISIETSKAITLLYTNLNNVAKERINVELSKLLVGRNAASILKQYTGVFLYVLRIADDDAIEYLQGRQEFFNAIHDFHTAIEVIKRIEDKDKDLSICLATIFYYLCDGDSEATASYLRKLRYNNDIIDEVVTLIDYYTQEVVANNVFVRFMFNKMGQTTFKKWLVMKSADVKMRKNFWQTSEAVETGILLSQFDEKNECYSLSTLAINGNDLIQLGLKQDKTMGIILNNVLFLVMNEKLKNNKEELIEYIKKTYGGEQYDG